MSRFNIAALALALLTTACASPEDLGAEFVEGDANLDTLEQPLREHESSWYEGAGSVRGSCDRGIVRLRARKAAALQAVHAAFAAHQNGRECRVPRPNVWTLGGAFWYTDLDYLDYSGRCGVSGKFAFLCYDE